MKTAFAEIMTIYAGRKKCVYRERVNVRRIIRNVGAVVTRPVLTGLSVTPFPAIVYVRRKIVLTMQFGIMTPVRVSVKVR